jgi:hypothetical protein
MAVVENDSESSTPRATPGFGPREDADATRQGQHQAANDTPVDVNPNAILARAQAETITQMGKSFEANADRRNKQFDDLAVWRSGKLT